MNLRRLTIALALLLTLLGMALGSRSSLAQGGPPLLTDDPDTPGNGRWEINLAATLQQDPYASLFQLPLADINYGLGDRIQLKVETGWVVRAGSDGSSSGGFGSALLGVKWRFLDQDRSGVSISTYPQVEIHHFLSSKDPQLLEPGSRVLLPIELNKSFGVFAIDGELGYQHFSHQFDEWLYGLAFGYTASETLELLAEGHGVARSDFSDSEFLLNAGTRYAFTERVVLLFSLGRTLTELSGDQSKWLAYLGVRLGF